MDTTENLKSRTCILILGMHRSGTSATAGCLDLYGYKLGKQIVPPGEPNEKGYFENNSINYFNECLLELLNARWYDTLHLPDSWWKDDRIKPMQSKLAKVLIDEFDSEGDLLIKDPRISVLLPFYLDVFKELNIIPKVIINFRNPFEVAASLKKRDNLSTSRSLLLWMDANIKAEFYSRLLPRLFLDYNSLLTDPVATMEQISKSLHLDKPTKEKKDELRLFIEKRLRHHAAKSTHEDAEIPKLISQMHDLLIELDLRDTKPNEQELFDVIKQQFLSEFRFFNGIDKTNKVVLKTIDEHEKSKHYFAPINIDNNKIQFFPDQSNVISEFWIYPINQQTALQLQNLIAKTIDGETVDVEINETNAEKILDNGIMIFESEFPWLRIKLSQASLLSQISCELQFLAFSDYTYRFSVKERNRIESELISKVAKLQTDNSNLIISHETVMAKLEFKLVELQKEKESLIANHLMIVNKLKTEILNLQKEKESIITDHKLIVAKHKIEIDNLQNKTNRIINDLKKANVELDSHHQTELKKLEVEKRELESNQIIAINKIKSEKAKLSEHLEFNSEQLQILMDSRSWKIGRSITWPIRKLKEINRQNEN